MKLINNTAKFQIVSVNDGKYNLSYLRPVTFVCFKYISRQLRKLVGYKHPLLPLKPFHCLQR